MTRNDTIEECADHLDTKAKMMLDTRRLSPTKEMIDHLIFIANILELAAKELRLLKTQKH